MNRRLSSIAIDLVRLAGRERRWRIGFDALAAGTRFWIEMPVEEPPSSLVHPDESATS